MKRKQHTGVQFFFSPFFSKHLKNHKPSISLYNGTFPLHTSYTREVKYSNCIYNITAVLRPILYIFSLPAHTSLIFFTAFLSVLLHHYYYYYLLLLLLLFIFLLSSPRSSYSSSSSSSSSLHQ